MAKHLDKWIGSYFSQNFQRVFNPRPFKKPIHVMFCCVDHYEPDWNNADAKTQSARVERWVKEYPVLAKRHQDNDGCHPRHSFFYPAEVYNNDHLEALAGICRQGFGEVEIHLHHDGDNEETLRAKLELAKKQFASHGLLSRRHLSGQVRFAFIHGNWALNNSRPDGKWCGVNNETKVLNDAGCYADFTFPSAPSPTQPSKINSVYYTKSSKHKPKMHNQGVDVSVGKFVNGDLMIVQGPLTLNWRNRSRGIFPRIENGDLTGVNPPTQGRVDLWVDQHISVRGKEDWIFIKVHTHGAQENNMDVLLGKPMDEMYSYLENKYNDGQNFFLHYVSAREMYNIIKAAEAGEQGSPNQYRNYILERTV